MRRSTYLAALVVIVASPLLRGEAEETHAWETPATTILCTEEQSTGFNWRNGKWHLTRFRGDTLIVKKVPNFKNDRHAALCRDVPPDRVSDPIALLSRCYKIKDHGTASPGIGEICAEIYLKSTSGSWSLDRVDCDDITFNPNGWFHRTLRSRDLSAQPMNDYKDSLVAAVGHCSAL